MRRLSRGATSSHILMRRATIKCYSSARESVIPLSEDFQQQYSESILLERFLRLLCLALVTIHRRVVRGGPNAIFQLKSAYIDRFTFYDTKTKSDGGEGENQ